VTGEAGTFVASTPKQVTINDVLATASATGASNATAGQLYTLNLVSYTDPGDPLLSWVVVWDLDNFTGSETELSILPAGATSATHVYSTVGTYRILWIAANGMDSPNNFEDLITVEVLSAPTAVFASGGAVDEGSTANVSFSDQFYSDPLVMAAGFRYAYDFNNDGIWEVGDGTYGGSDASDSAIVPAAYIADGDASYTIKGRIIAQDGAFSDFTTLVVVENVTPSANPGGPYATFDDTPITLVGTATDPAGVADPLVFKWDLDADNIFGETGAGAARGNEVGASVTYNPVGLPTSTQTVKLQVSDGDGGVTVATTTVQIIGQGTTLVGGVLYVVGGNTTSDMVMITQSGSTITVFATSSPGGVQTFSAASITDMQIRTRDGNDVVVISSNVTATMTIDGGAGNDLLTGGSGRNVLIGGIGNDILYGAAGDDILFGGAGNDDLFGGDGNDVIVGGNGNDILNGGIGRDVLIGGQDNDRLEGGADDDALIGGITIHDSNVGALDAVMAIWESAVSFSTRVATLTASGGLLQAGVAVFDDDDHDTLIGNAGRDLYFGDNNPADHVTDAISLQVLQDQLIAVT
jgi:Ca2+-binding RTX toxin-like protein